MVFDLETNADRPHPSEHEIIQIGRDKHDALNDARMTQQVMRALLGDHDVR